MSAQGRERAVGERMRTGLLLGTAALASVCFSLTEARAQDVEEEIIVTATKREQAIQDIPLSVTAIGAETLQTTGANEFADYATSVPNLSFGFAGEGRQTSRNFQLRGIFGADTSALYIGETAVPVTMDPRVIDLSRVEVLRGPQGSLFGARSMGGLVRLVPQAPEIGDFGGSAHVSYGQVEEGGDDTAFDLTLNIPLGPQAALRITGYTLEDAGFIDRMIDPDASNIARPLLASIPFTNGDEFIVEDINQDTTTGVQVAMQIEPTERITITPRVMYQITESNGPAFVDNSVENLLKIRQYDVEETGEDEWFLASLEARVRVDNGEWVSATSYFNRSTLDVEDSTLFMGTRVGGRVRSGVATPAITSEIGDDERFTQELRFVSEFDGNMQLIAGLFYQDIALEGGFPPQSIVPAGSQLINVFGSGIVAGDSFFSLATETDQTEMGLFGEVEFSLSPELTLIAGGRFFNVETEQTRDDGGVLFSKLGPIFSGAPPGFDPPRFTSTQEESGFNPRVALTWEPNDDFTLYGNVARGFRPGRVNATAGACAALGVTVPNEVSSDSLWNYEAGAKFSLFGGRARVNSAAYFIQWDDRQTQTVNCGGLGFGAFENVGSAESSGAELEITADLFEGLSLTAGIGYTNAEVTDTGGVSGVAVGDPLANVPEVNGALALDYERSLSAGLDFYARTDYRFVGESVSAQKSIRPDYALTNLRIGIRSETWDLSLFGQNLGDERANLADPVELSDALNLIAIARPRTIGLDLRARF